jgi:hypothetical protein
MKKLACAAIALIMGVGVASAAVESDIVGYQTVEVTNEWTLLGVNFVGLEDASAKEIPILSLISGEFGAGDQVQIPTANGYTIAEWNPAVGKWCTVSRGKVTENPSTAKISAGAGFWLKSTATVDNPKVVQFAGKVYDGDDISVTLGQQYTIFSPLLPSEVAVNSELLTWANLEHGDQVQIPTANGYEVAGWNSTLNAWCTISRNKVTNTPSTVSIKAGESIWVVSTNADASVAFPSPISE